MSERKDFFQAVVDERSIREGANSPDSTQRWFAVIQLSQIIERWSCDLLWGLKDDEDESTRVAARNALRNFPKEFLTGRTTEEFSSEPISVSIWKVRPLPTLNASSRDLFLAAVLDLLNAEGATTGGRIFRLLGACNQASGSKTIGRGQVKQLLDDLHKANRIARVDEHLDSDLIDSWIVIPRGWPEYVIRPRNSRDLRDIPITEARAVLRNDRRFMRDTTKTDLGFRALREQYEIADNEFHVVGEALENQWLGLFKNL